MTTPPHTMAALITPFDEAGVIDTGAHRHNLRLLTNRGLVGFLIGGSTGQGPYLEPGECTVLTGVAREELGVHVSRGPYEVAQRPQAGRSHLLRLHKQTHTQAANMDITQ